MTAHPDGSGGPHVFVADLAQPVFEPGDHHHLAKVLRLRSGDPLTLTDGAGRWCAAHFADQPTVGSDPVFVPAGRSLGVAFALVKGSKPELVVQKLTELGLDQIALFSAERSIVRWDDAKIAKQAVRLGRVAREAAMQSRRVRLPELHFDLDFKTLSALDGAMVADLGVADARTSGVWDGSGSWVLIGPEGGWTTTEQQLSRVRVSLGATVLRAETAAIAAAVRMTACRELESH